jgi:hypothetical protein
MDRDSIERKYTQVWGHEAHVLLYRISGNRSAYSVTDHNGHWVSLSHRWAPGGLLFEEVA